MIDRATGQVWVEDHDEPIRPLMTIQAFLATKLGQESRSNASVLNNEYQFIVGPCTLSGANFMLCLNFRNRKLIWVQLSPTLAQPRKTWLDRLIGRFFASRTIPELEAKVMNDRWLAEVLGQTKESVTYRWGSVTSVYFEAWEGSCIQITYAL